MSLSILDQIATDGFAFFNHYRCGQDAATVASGFGRPLTPWVDRLVQDLAPAETAPPNTYSGIYGLDRFPFHTDLAHWHLPPRYLLLRCVVGYTSVPTLLADGKALLEAVRTDVLTRAIFKPRRPRDGTLTLLRICDPVDGGYRLRWDEVFLRPASRLGELAATQIQKHLAGLEPLSVALAHEGDTLLINNWRMLHARSPIPKGCIDRRIQRVYLEALH